MPADPTTPDRSAGAPGAGRTRRDRCPGVLRPWLADDGALVRLRLPGGGITVAELAALADVADAHGDGRVRPTARANVQLRGLPSHDGATAPGAHAALLATGLVPAPDHERVRNVMASPLSGIAGGLADLRPVVGALDDALCADPVLAGLPGRFLFVLDDGRGDLLDRGRDLGVLARSATHGQLLLGSHERGPVLPLADVPATLTGLARAFLTARGDGADAPWHVDELPPTAPGQRPWHHPYTSEVSPRVTEPERVSDGDISTPGPDVATGHFLEPDVAIGHPQPVDRGEPLPDGEVAPGWVHHLRPDGLDRADVTALTAGLGSGTRLVVTPWRGVLVPTTQGTV